MEIAAVLAIVADIQLTSVYLFQNNTRLMKIRILVSLIIGIAFVGSLRCQAPYLLLWDDKASPITSAENLITAHKGLYDFKDKYIKPSYWQEDWFVYRVRV
jgi:hypothetical protein